MTTRALSACRCFAGRPQGVTTRRRRFAAIIKSPRVARAAAARLVCSQNGAALSRVRRPATHFAMLERAVNTRVRLIRPTIRSPMSLIRSPIDVIDQKESRRHRQTAPKNCTLSFGVLRPSVVLSHPLIAVSRQSLSDTIVYLKYVLDCFIFSCLISVF